MRIPGNQRVAVVGTTGSGKSFLARFLLSKRMGVERLIAFDPKGDMNRKEWDLPDDWKQGYQKLLKGKAARVYIPSIGLDGDESIYDGFLRQIFNLRGVIVYVDELYLLVKNPIQGSVALRALYTQGRALGIGVWSSVQRPTQIPLYTLSESEWKFVFTVRMDSDKKRMADLSGLKALPHIGKYQFVLSAPLDIQSRPTLRKLDKDSGQLLVIKKL